VVTPNTLRTPVLTWDDSTRPSRRRRLGRRRTGPGRTVTFCSGIAFPSTHDHGELCPRQARSAPPDQTICCSDHKRRTTVRSYTTVGADTAWASTRPTATPPRPRRPPCRTQPVLASPRRLGQSPPSRPGHGRPWPGPSRRGTGVPSARSAPMLLRAPGRRRLHRDRPPPPGTSPVATPPPAWRLPPSASAVSHGWSRPRTASDSGGAPP
jgi:hypothetical protein